MHEQFQTPAQYYIAYIRCVPIYFANCYIHVYDKCYYYFRTFIAKTIRYFKVFLFHFVKEFIFNNDLIALEIKYLHLYILDLSRAAV